MRCGLVESDGVEHDVRRLECKLVTISLARGEDLTRKVVPLEPEATVIVRTFAVDPVVSVPEAGLDMSIFEDGLSTRDIRIA